MLVLSHLYQYPLVLQSLQSELASRVTSRCKTSTSMIFHDILKAWTTIWLNEDLCPTIATFLTTWPCKRVPASYRTIWANFREKYFVGNNNLLETQNRQGYFLLFECLISQGGGGGRSWAPKTTVLKGEISRVENFLVQAGVEEMEAVLCLGWIW